MTIPTFWGRSASAAAAQRLERAARPTICLTADVAHRDDAADVLCTDVRMPTGNGLSFCETLAASEETRGYPADRPDRTDATMKRSAAANGWEPVTSRSAPTFGASWNRYSIISSNTGTLAR